MPIDNYGILDSNGDLGRKDNIFDMLGGNLDNFLSLSYLSGYDASFDLYCIYLGHKRKKILWNTFLIFLLIFLWLFLC